MFDEELADLLSTGHAPDRIAYGCSGCGHITYAPAGLITIICGRCEHRACGMPSEDLDTILRPTI